MGNTVGSYWNNKYLQKRWVNFKIRLRLTSRQKSVLIGSLLGDGTLRLGVKAINVNFKVEHGLQQKEYVWWKYLIFKEWVFTGPKLSYRYREDRTKYLKSWWFRTVRHPILTKYWNLFYLNGKKIVPNTIWKYINNQVLAVWIMDDGCYQKGKIDVSTYAFTLEEIHQLQEALRTKFNLSSNYYKDREKGYRIYFSAFITKKVIDIIRPYIIPSMQYKIGYSNNPVTTDSRIDRDEMEDFHPFITR